MKEFACVIPILNVKNFAASMDYYVNKLGFQKKWDWREPPTFGCVARGKVEIFFCQGAQRQAGTWMSIFLSNVDELHEECKKNGAIIRMLPTNMPWGLGEMKVKDPDGHRFRMGRARPGQRTTRRWNGSQR
jgi:Glyoxalase/Bleomycin resistance protein/Dioxygenase superfamily